MKHISLFLAAMSLCAGLGAAELFKKDLSDASCKKDVWSFDDKGELGSTVDEILWTKNQYENFELNLEFSVTKEGNGGVIVYATDTDKWIPDSIEIQIADNGYWMKQFGDRGICGAIFGFQGPAKDATKPLGEWNKLRLVCKGQSIQVWINGELVNDFDMSKFIDAKKNPDGTEPFKWLQNTPRSKVPTKGHIGFQGRHGKGDAKYRNLEIKPLN